MSTVVICLAAFALVAAAASFGLSLRIRQLARRGAPPRIGCRVTVHTKQPDDQTFFGVLTGDYADRLVLEDCDYVTPAAAQPLPGKQHIATRDVAWIDVHALVATPDSGPASASARPPANQAEAAV